MQISSYSQTRFSYRDDTGKDISVKTPTKQQKSILEEIFNCCNERWDNPEYDVHALWHSVPEYEKGMGGYEYSCLLEEWAKDKPQVKQFRFDDTMFMGSVGFIVPNMSKYQHMGLSVVLCPQCGEPFDFFCYPSHVSSLLKAFGAAEVDLLSVPDIDESSPLFLKTEELKKRLLDSIN